MNRINCIFFCVGFLVCHTLSVEVSREAEGYPTGFLSDCPGSERKVTIPSKAYKKLFIITQGKNKNGSYKKRFNYFTAVKGMRSVMDFSKNTVLFASGFLDSTSFPVPRTVAAYYQDLDYNIILLDTNRFTTFAYPVASRLMRPVGRKVGQMLAELASVGLDPGKTELLGLSLGGHTISYIAKSFREVTGRNISRITALDPAGPCFRNLPPNDRLDASDADFVDVIHTNIDSFGTATPLGHVNWYVNGGEYQPGDVPWIPCTDMCSHARAYTLWLGALANPDKCLAIKCDSVQEARDNKCYGKVPLETALLGLNTDRSARGIFYLTTDYSYPYCIGKKGVLEEYQVWKANMAKFNEFDIYKL